MDVHGVIVLVILFSSMLLMTSLGHLKWLHQFACLVLLPKIYLTHCGCLTASRCPTTMLVLLSVGVILYDTVLEHLPTAATIAGCIFFSTSPFLFPLRGNCDLFLGECDFAFTVSICHNRLLSLVCIAVSVILIHIRSYVQTVTLLRVHLAVVTALTICMIFAIEEVNSHDYGSTHLEIMLPFGQL